MSKAKQRTIPRPSKAQEISALRKDLSSMLGNVGQQVAEIQHKTSILWDLLWTLMEFVRDESGIDQESFEKRLSEYGEILKKNRIDQRRESVSDQLVDGTLFCQIGRASCRERV